MTQDLHPAHVHALGIGGFLLHAQVDNLDLLKPVSEMALGSNYLFKPDESHYFRIDHDFIIKRYEHFELRDVFIAIDKEHYIKRLFCFAEGSKNHIVKSLDELLGTTHLSGISVRDGHESADIFFWNTELGSTISLIDLSANFKTPTCMISYVGATDFESISKYMVIKTPWNKLS